MIEPISAANWRAAVAFDPETLELMARAYLGLGGVPVVEFDGDVVVGVWVQTSVGPRANRLSQADEPIKPASMDAVFGDVSNSGDDQINSL